MSSEFQRGDLVVARDYTRTYRVGVVDLAWDDLSYPLASQCWRVTFSNYESTWVYPPYIVAVPRGTNDLQLRTLCSILQGSS